jgi:hypothetical protein
MVIRYSDGSSAEGVIHRLEGGTMRAAVAGVEDVMDYKLILDHWTSEMGVVVTFEFTVDRELDLFQIVPAMMDEGRERCAAGGDCVLRQMSGSGAGRVN